MNQVDPITAAPHLRLVWPQWQGAGTESVRSLAPEFSFDIAWRGYSVGTKVLQAVLPEQDGPTAIVPVEMGGVGLEERDGIEAKAVVLQQLRSALARPGPVAALADTWVAGVPTRMPRTVPTRTVIGGPLLRRHGSEEIPWRSGVTNAVGNADLE